VATLAPANAHSQEGTMAPSHRPRAARLLAAALGLLADGSASGQTDTVTNTYESGAGSLRAAIAAANGDNGAFTIHFDNNLRTIDSRPGDERRRPRLAAAIVRSRRMACHAIR
jgi:hypothetical protein